jgi:hypothetical protein
MSDCDLVSKKLANRVAWSALGILLLTSVHHAYGAYIYSTPWRLHVVFVSALTAAAITGSLLVLGKRPTHSGVAFWVFTAVTLLMPVLAIGLFEGGYNHALKDALYFGGASTKLMRHLFPPPTYELPNNLFFEMSGVMQLIVGAMTGGCLYRFIRARRTTKVRARQAQAA